MICRLTLLASAFVLTSCGVKGPPLPVVPATPQQSEYAVRPSPAPNPNFIGPPAPAALPTSIHEHEADL
ncbi:MAG: lipoprotein [Oligoflexia bacterium]|nr:lipoprotein [Oligoflexia bacterium]